jgi:CheY-like chemotaxis protein
LRILDFGLERNRFTAIFNPKSAIQNPKSRPRGSHAIALRRLRRAIYSHCGAMIGRLLSSEFRRDGMGTTVSIGKAKILLVEDHDDTARALARLLNLSGYQVQTAATFQTALRMCGEEKFDLLISDVGLPDGSGYDLMREILSRRCVSKGIAVSGYGTEQDVEQSRQAGFTEHLVKPVSIEILRDTIQRVILT